MSLGPGALRFIESMVLPRLPGKECVVSLGVPKIDGDTENYWPTFRERFGFARVEAIDLSTYQGAEIKHDLCEPLPESLHGIADFVVDPGTLEHIFNPGEGLCSVAKMLKAGGMAFHLIPLNLIDHGFFNPCPVLYHDFYRANGCEIKTYKDDRPWPTEDELLVTKILPNRTLIYAVAKRRALGPVVRPIHRRFTGWEGWKAGA